MLRRPFGPTKGCVKHGSFLLPEQLANEAQYSNFELLFFIILKGPPSFEADEHLGQ